VTSSYLDLIKLMNAQKVIKIYLTESVVINIYSINKIPSMPIKLPYLRIKNIRFFLDLNF